MDSDSDVPIRRSRVVPSSSNREEDVSQPQFGSPHSPNVDDGDSRKRQRLSQATTVCVPPESVPFQGDLAAERSQCVQRRGSRRLILIGGAVSFDPQQSLVDEGDESVLVEGCVRTPRSQERIAEAVPVVTPSTHMEEECDDMVAFSNEQSDTESISGVSEVEGEHEQPSPPDPVLIPDSIRNAATGRGFVSLDVVNSRHVRTEGKFNESGAPVSPRSFQSRSEIGFGRGGVGKTRA